MHIAQRMLTAVCVVVFLAMGDVTWAQGDVKATAVQDTFLRAARPDTNYGFNATFLSGNDPADWRTDGLVQFELPDAPAGQEVQTATLELYMPQLEWANRGSANFGVMAVMFDWSEEDDTWDTLDADFADYGDTVYDTVWFEGLDPPFNQREDLFPEEWVTWDVTELVQAWYDGSIENNGLAVLGEARWTGGAAGAVIFPQFTSKDSGDEDLYPVISITFGDAAPPGDFNKNGVLDLPDINMLNAEISAGTNNLDFDLNADSMVDAADQNIWVKDLKNTWFGDANLDGEFNSTDLVVVFQANKFEADSDAGWHEGDWNADLRFGSGDLVRAFQDSGFEAGPRPAAAVPEPASLLLVALAGICVYSLRRPRA